MLDRSLQPCVDGAAENLFPIHCTADNNCQLVFSSFEDGIANAISSFKWQKLMNLFLKESTSTKLDYLTNVPCYILSIEVAFVTCLGSPCKVTTWARLDILN